MMIESEGAKERSAQLKEEKKREESGIKRKTTNEEESQSETNTYDDLSRRNTFLSARGRKQRRVQNNTSGSA